MVTATSLYWQERASVEMEFDDGTVESKEFTTRHDAEVFVAYLPLLAQGIEVSLDIITDDWHLSPEGPQVEIALRKRVVSAIIVPGVSSLN